MRKASDILFSVNVGDYWIDEVCFLEYTAVDTQWIMKHARQFGGRYYKMPFKWQIQFLFPDALSSKWFGDWFHAFCETKFQQTRKARAHE